MHLYDSPGSSRRRCLAMTVCLVLLTIDVVSVAWAGDGPARGCVATQRAASSDEPILAPAPPLDWLPFPMMGELFFSTIPPTEPNDKGSILTNMGAGVAPPQPNAFESLKLQMARSAIEASRAAGTLWVVPAEMPAQDPKTDALQQKLIAVQNAPSLPLQPDPAACVGGSLAPLQIAGPPGLTPQERAKLDATSIDADAVPEQKEGR